MDLEVQFTDIAEFSEFEKLCIYTGALGAEDLRVDYWDGDSWETLTTALTANSWNNYTVSLASSNYTLRFSGGNEIGDTTQDSWGIDAVLLTRQEEYSQYYSSGIFTSQKRDMGQGTNFIQISWTLTQPSGTEVKFKIRSAPTEVELDSATWYGPTGTDDYYTNPTGTTINPVHNGDRWIQYQTYLSSTDPTNTPELEDVSISY